MKYLVLVFLLSASAPAQSASLFDCLVKVRDACVTAVDYLFIDCGTSLAKKTGPEFVDYFLARSDLGKRTLITGLAERLSDQSSPTKINYVLARHYLNLLWRERTQLSPDMRRHLLQSIVEHALPATPQPDVRLLALDLAFSLVTSAPNDPDADQWQTELNNRLGQIARMRGLVLPDVSNPVAARAALLEIGQFTVMQPGTFASVLDRFHEYTVNVVGVWLDRAMAAGDQREFRHTLAYLMEHAHYAPEITLAVYHRLALASTNDHPFKAEIAQQLSTLRAAVRTLYGPQLAAAQANYLAAIQSIRSTWPKDWRLATNINGSLIVTDRAGNEIGFLSVLKTADTLTIWWMETAPTERGRGIGSALVAAMLVRFPYETKVHASLDMVNRNVFLDGVQNRPEMATEEQIRAALAETPLAKSLAKIGFTQLTIEDALDKYPSFTFGRTSNVPAAIRARP